MHKLNDLLLMGAIKLQPVIMAAGLADGYQREIDRKVKQLNDLFYSLIGILGALAGGCLTFFGVYFGMKYSIAKKDNAEEAKKQMVRLIVGAVLSAILGIVGGIALNFARKQMVSNLMN